jgi:hypothetical protein
MLKTIQEITDLIDSGKLLHIAASAELLRKLPKGNWIGGTTEYFVVESGGIVSDTVLSVIELPFPEFTIKTYDQSDLKNMTKDAYPNGFTIIIVPAFSEIHSSYAQNASAYENIFLNNVVGWVSGFNLGKENQAALTINGQTGEISTDKAVVLQIGLPQDKIVQVNIINIFEPDKSTPLITFPTQGFSSETAFVDGKEINFAQYLRENDVNTKLPLVGDYSGAGINVSIQDVDEKTVKFYAPVFDYIHYRFAKPVDNYENEFKAKIAEHKGSKYVFACNCILNFLYGKLEGKDLGGYYGPVTFGEIAWQLLNQTLVYLEVD